MAKPSKLLPRSLAAAAWLAAASTCPAARPYVNDLKAPANRKDLETIQQTVISALEKVRPATVCIDLGEGSGSGVIVSPDGLVLTAAHVSTGVRKELTVVLEDGTRLKAESLGLVADSDAAMIRITEENGGPYPHVEIDRENSTRLGDWVFSLGHSGGFDVKRGSVLRVGRLVRIANRTIQSDCMLIGGDSGGPLFDLNGRLIGIHSRVGQHLQVNMHVPIREFLDHWEEMLAAEFIGEGPFATAPVKGRGYLGFASEPHETGGLRVTRVGEDSPAAEAGLEVGDVILKCNGTELSTREQLQELLAEMAAGDKVTLETRRGDEARTVECKLAER